MSVDCTLLNAGLPTPPVAVVGSSVRLGHRQLLEKVVLEEQRRALRSRRRRNNATDDSPALTSGERSRLVALALRVVAEAAILAEAECHRILQSAEAEAEDIVNQAHADVVRLMGWLEVGIREADDPGFSRSAPTPTTPAADLVNVPRDATIDVDDPDESGAEFFAGFDTEGPDRWAFMDEDSLVGVGPALVRRLLRRPSGNREQLAERQG